MAGLLNILQSNQATKDIAKYNAANNNGGNHTVLGYTLATGFPSIFTNVLNKIETRTNGNGGSEASDSSKSFNKQRKGLEKQLNEALSKLGIQDPRQINETVSEAQNRSQARIADAQAAVDIFKNGTDSYSQQIDKLRTQLTTSTDTENSTFIREQIDALEAKRTQAKADAETNLKNTETTETAKIKEIQENAEKAYEIFQKLSELIDLPDGDSDYVKEKNETLHEFNNQRTIFLTSTDSAEKKNAARKIKEMAENTNNQNDRNIQSTYRLLRVRIDKCLK